MDHPCVELFFWSLPPNSTALSKNAPLYLIPRDNHISLYRTKIQWVGAKLAYFFHFVSVLDDPFLAPTFYWCVLWLLSHHTTPLQHTLSLRCLRVKLTWKCTCMSRLSQNYMVNSNMNVLGGISYRYLKGMSWQAFLFSYQCVHDGRWSVGRGLVRKLKGGSLRLWWVQITFALQAQWSSAITNSVISSHRSPDWWFYYIISWGITVLCNFCKHNLIPVISCLTSLTFWSLFHVISIPFVQKLTRLGPKLFKEITVCVLVWLDRWFSQHISCQWNIAALLC